MQGASLAVKPFPVLAFAAALAFAAPLTAQADDAWGPKTILRAPDGWYSTPIHGSLLPDGRLHLIGIERPTEDPLAAPR